jgi:phospholipase/carboxylesterase
MDPEDLPLEHVSRGPRGSGASGVGGDERERERGGERVPAVLVCHGRGADEFDLLGLAESFPAGVHVLSLRAPFPGPRGRGHAWYELDRSGGGLHASQPGEGFREGLDALHAFAEHAPEAYPVEVAGIVGFSQGGIVGLAATLERPGLYDRVAALHAYLPASHDPGERSFEGVAGTPAFLAAGEADEVIPASRTAAAADTLREAGLGVTFERFAGGHGISRAEHDALVAWLDDRLR